MGKLDEEKEKINSLRFYLGLIVAMIIALGSGVAKLFNSGNYGISFSVGTVLIVILVIVFGVLAKRKHKLIRKLREIR